MKQWLIKQSNTSVQDIPVYDKDGALLTNLATTASIKFQVKKNKTDASTKIAKTKGAGIEVNTPSAGYLRITLTSTDTAIDVGDYYMALELQWGSSEIYEVIIEIDDEKTDRFRIQQDII